jgi:glycoprotein 6-alpha-L-fucosyltransferase
MRQVEQFYDKLDLQTQFKEHNHTLKRIVYLATDDPDVWRKEIVPYQKKGYQFICDEAISQTAEPNERHSFNSLQNIILDVLLLSQCDYLVCTFSSQVCRLAYELMQTKITDERVDWSSAAVSIDDVYYFGGQIFHGKIAIVSHQAKNANEISFKYGDVLGIDKDLKNGYNLGENKKHMKQRSREFI